MATFKQGSFELEGYGTFTGWTAGETWNGWKCPRFEKGEADRILAACIQQGSRGAFVPELDLYIIEPSDGGDPELFRGATIPTPDGDRHIYPIGAWSWTWFSSTISYKCPTCKRFHESTVVSQDQFLTCPECVIAQRLLDLHKDAEDPVALALTHQDDEDLLGADWDAIARALMILTDGVDPCGEW